MGMIRRLSIMTGAEPIDRPAGCAQILRIACGAGPSLPAFAFMIQAMP
jgi:hypothetical protein